MAKTARRFSPITTFAGYQRSWLAPDIIAGVTLAAVAIPECMGYTKIVATPVVTGLYTILLPIAAFALIGSSRHLVVGADSATAAILFAGLTGLAQPFSSAWLTLASASALITAGFLLLARLARLGFLANFLSRTVLVGFLSGVGISLLIGQLPDMLGVAVKSGAILLRLGEIWNALPTVHLPTLIMAAAVLAIILLTERFARALPGSLLAVALAIAVTWIFRLDQHGIAVVGNVQAGFPPLRFPAVSPATVGKLVATSASMFVVIVAQSAATSRSFAQKHDETFDENRDLVGLAVANALAGVSSSFVVNGSPTKTAVVDAAGGRTQVAQLTTAVVTLVVVLFATGLIARLPNAALAAIVFLIGARLIDLRSLRNIFQFRKATFAVAVATLLAVVFLGVERGIFLAIGLSILDHLQREYHPKDVVLTFAQGRWQAQRATPGVTSAPGLLIYRFQAPLFFANADYFAYRLQALVQGGSPPVRRLVLDLVSVDDIDYTAGLVLLATLTRLQQEGVTIALAQAEDVRLALDRLGITVRLGSEHLFATVQEAVDAVGKEFATHAR
ncbi:MAG TPA: SulP family inorganic anion transporter [Chloroflexota bacterium]|nr:SulP family inorganic anion transporter [Chloroflexota bacterium]